MAQDERPRIGVTGPARGAVGPRTCVAFGLWLAGARAIQLRPGDDVGRSRLEELDGFVITGGHDVEPSLYRAVAEVHGNYDPERDRFESEVIDEALALRRPLLGVCRGAQLLNVRCGGTLVQDLAPHRTRTSNRRTLLPLKRAFLGEGARVRECTRREVVRVNSLHRQAIEELGEGLAVTARDLDDIVQAVELDAGTFTVGVQWHPEFLLYLAPQRRLFAALVEAARDGARAS